MMTTMLIKWTLSDPATPEVIAAFLQDWQPEQKGTIHMAARYHTAEYAKRLILALEQECSSPGIRQLEDIATALTGHANGFLRGLAWLYEQLAPAAAPPAPRKEHRIQY